MSSTTLSAEYEIVPAEDDPDDGRALMKLLVKELRRRLSEAPQDFTAAEITATLRLLNDNSVSLQSIKRGDFGNTAQRVAEQFPFPSGPQESLQ
jgi:hypothetical protein